MVIKKILQSKPIIFLLALSLQGFVMKTQQNPLIGSEKDTKEKLTLIKKALPDFRKSLTKVAGVSNSYHVVILKMGDGDIQFREMDSIQSLIVRYSSAGFTGNIAEYQHFYLSLIKLTKKVFGWNYISTEEKKGSRWESRFFQKGSDYYHSYVSIKIICDWTIASLGPDIEWVINSKLEYIVPKTSDP
jgi:hypothetical protein